MATTSEHALAENLAAEVAGALDADRTLPAHWYTDPAILELEETHIFRRSWQPFTTLDDLREPGQYVSGEIGGVPIVLVRDKEGELRGFVNVCRHRAHIVADGKGKKSLLQCPYHAWTYGLDGELKAVPRAPADFEKEDRGLVPVQVGTWGDLVFVKIDPSGPSLDEAFGELREVSQSASMDLDGLRLRAVEDWEFQCNWKVFYDNSAECYHCPTVHPGFTAEYHVSEDAYALTAHDGFIHHISPRKSKADDTTRDWEMCSWWPNWSMATGEHHGMTLVWVFTPLEAERTRVYTWFFASDDLSDEQVRYEVSWWKDVVYGEDRLACESVQRGLHSGVIPDGALVVGSEHIIQKFQEGIRTAFESEPLERLV